MIAFWKQAPRSEKETIVLLAVLASIVVGLIVRMYVLTLPETVVHDTGRADRAALVNLIDTGR